MKHITLTIENDRSDWSILSVNADHCLLRITLYLSCFCRRRPDALCGPVQSNTVQVVWRNGHHQHGKNPLCQIRIKEWCFLPLVLHFVFYLSNISGAGETGGWKDRVDSAAFTPVHDPATWNRHVQSECEFVSLYFSMYSACMVPLLKIGPIIFFTVLLHLQIDKNTYIYVF